MVNRFGSDFLASENIWNQDSNVILDTSIYYDKYSILINKRILIDIVQFIAMAASALGFFWLTEIKEKWSEKLSTRQKPGVSSMFRLLDEGKI